TCVANERKPGERLEPASPVDLDHDYAGGAELLELVGRRRSRHAQRAVETLGIESRGEGCSDALAASSADHTVDVRGYADPRHSALVGARSQDEAQIGGCYCRGFVVDAGFFS